MIEGENKVLQAFLGTLLTWGLTAAGSAMVFIFGHRRFNGKRKILDTSLGFAAGVMTAASYWSLLAPAIDMAEKSGTYGEKGAFAPVAVGFFLGGVFVFISDICIPKFATEDPSVALAMYNQRKKYEDKNSDHNPTLASIVSEEPSREIDQQSPATSDPELITSVENGDKVSLTDSIQLKIRNRKNAPDKPEMVLEYQIESREEKKAIEAAERKARYESWKRMLLLIIAITVHNIPEGLAVGVAFGAIGSSSSATFSSARSLAIGIGVQNFPEGMAVSVPLCAAGYSPLKSFWYGQLSGMVEPIFGVLGSLVVVVAEPILPYALAFAAGAMIYVVVDDIIPEANMCGNGRYASWGTMLGFIVMMSLDVALG